MKIIFEKSIKGVLGSVKIENENFDLDTNFLMALIRTEKFIKDMFSNEDLYDFKYGASYFYKPTAFMKIMQCHIEIL